MPFNGNLYDVFLMIKLRLCITGRKTTDVKWHFLHIVSRVHIVNIIYVDLDHLPEEVFIRFIHYQVTLCHLSILYSLERYKYVQHTLKEWGAILPYLEGRVSTKTIWNSSASLSSLIYYIHSFIHLNHIDSWILILYFGL